jgi:bacillithiol biosynthesis cysteine-adding enzyme BshC
MPIDIKGFYSPLYRDFISGRGPVSISPSFQDTSSWKSVAERALNANAATERFWDATEDFNRRIGAEEEAMRKIAELRARKSVAVVTGQQPGLLGGPLLVLYKAATCVALSDYVADVTGVPCSPVFIVASDDSDFVEIAQCTLYDAMLRRLSLEFPGDEYKAGLMVGGLSIDEEMRLAGSLRQALAGMPGMEQVSALLRGVGSLARDHGEFVAALLSSTFSPDGLVVVDGRDPAMREAGASLFQAYVSRRTELRNAVAAAGDEIVRMGYHAQIAAGSLDSWLFVLDGGVRKKVGEGSVDELELIAKEHPESLSPNVALRPIWRESTLPTVCCICGPSEVSYSLQLKEAYSILGVRLPVLFPRLSVTLVPGEGEELAGGWSKGALEALLEDFAGVQARHYRSSIPSDVVQAIDRAKGSLDESIADLAKALGGHSNRWAKGADSLRMATAKGLEKLEQDMIEGLKRDRQRDNPRLKGIGEFLLPEGKLQERILSFIHPFIEVGPSFARDVLALARSHVKESASGRVMHYCYGLEDRGGAVTDG